MKKVIYLNIEAERAKKQLNQTEFARLIGINNANTYYRRLVQGGWTAEELKLLRQNVNDDLSYLLEHFE